MKKRMFFITVLCVIFTLFGCYSGEVSEEQRLSVHYIDVGQADSTLLISQGDAMLIDGGNAEDSSLIYSYLSDYNVKELDYVIATHPHEDHMGGLTAALEKAKVGRIYLPDAENDGAFYKKFIKKAQDKNIEMTYAQNGESFSLGACDVTLFVAEDMDKDNLNNTSVMAKVVCGNKAFLFTGDAEREAEAKVIEQGADLSASVLKAPHHGSDTSSSYQFLREVMPEIIVVSSGKGNSYGHPHKEVMSRYNDLGAKVYRTDENGHIIINTDGESLSVITAKNNKPPEEYRHTAPEEYSYIGNTSSKKLHLPSCRNLPKEENRVYFISRDDAIYWGFTPCGGCNP